MPYGSEEHDGRAIERLHALAHDLEVLGQRLDSTSLTLLVEVMECVVHDEGAGARIVVNRWLRGASSRRLTPVEPHSATMHRLAGPCSCECNRGGFCGGCGHAGCGRRG